MKYPYHKSVPKFTAKRFQKELKGKFHRQNALRDFAKMEFHMEKIIHRDELSKVSKWWKEIDLSKELKLARNQPVKLYTWTMACLPDLRLWELILLTIHVPISTENMGTTPDELRSTWAILCDGFLVEAKWFKSKAKPKANEYLNTARVTSGIHIPVAHMFPSLAPDENQDGHDGSYIDYYINEHKRTTVQSAKQHVLDMIANEWNS
ncbi:hypothetical protein LIER_39271 [Lithospermum erythrorhizon]|uniref:Terpene synthase metal-binding domain-containing protein n=1 Tax=Lithospermum erythrorhizon TaxID=34254 RepID=A0AAV3QCA9_LITER